jgi:hypothetical protein
MDDAIAASQRGFGIRAEIAVSVRDEADAHRAECIAAA